MTKKQFTYQSRSIPATPRNRRLTDSIQAAAGSGGTYYGGGPSVPQYWELVTTDASGNTLPEGSEYVSTKYAAHSDGNLMAKKDIVAYAIDDSIEDIALPLASYSQVGIVRVKESSGLIITDGLLSVDPSYADGGGLDEEQLLQYLTSNKYITQDGLKDYMKLTTPLTGYALPASYTAITDKDTVLSALGKLEKNFGNYVDLTTNQTIAGMKTFTDSIYGKKDIVCYAVDGSVEDLSFPIASPTQLGMIKVGANLTISNGVLSAQSGGVSFTPGTALELTSGNMLNVKLGTISGTACAGDDGRLSDARRNPYSLTWDGYSSGSYNGESTAKISIPNNTNQLTNGAGYITGITKQMVLNVMNNSGDGFKYLNGNGSFSQISYSQLAGLPDLSVYISRYGDTMYGDLTISKNTPSVFLSGSRTWQIYESGGDLAFKNNGDLAAYFSGVNNGNFVVNKNLMAKGDVVAYYSSSDITDITAVAGQNTYGVVKYDNSTIRVNSSGQLYCTVTGGSSNSPVWYPSVNSSGYLTWTNNSTTTAPSGTYIKGQGTSYQWSGTSLRMGTISSSGSTTWGSYVDLRGPQGPQGIQGPQGPKGDPGSSGSWNGGTVNNGITIQYGGLTISSNGYGISMPISSPFINGSNHLNFKVNNVQRFQIGTGGYVFASGFINLGPTIIHSSSDIRRKNVLSHLNNVLEAIDRMSVFRYTFKDDTTNQIRIGMSAQEVMPYFPELIFTNNEYYAMDYMSLSSVAIQGIKELYSQHLTLENSIKSLSSWRLTKDQQIKHLMRENDLLKARVTELEGRAA